MSFTCDNCGGTCADLEAVKAHNCSIEYQALVIYVDDAEYKMFGISAGVDTNEALATGVMQAWLNETHEIMAKEGVEDADWDINAWRLIEHHTFEHVLYVRYAPYRGEDVTFLINL